MERFDPVIIPAKNYYGPCYSPNKFLEKKDGYERFYNWSDHLKDLSKGFVYQLKCQPGLILAITRQSPSTAISISHEEEMNFVSLCFILQDGSYIRHHTQEQETGFCSNQGGLTYARCKTGLVHCPTVPFCAIGILMEPWFIKRFLQGIDGDFARKIERKLTLQNEGENFDYPVSMSPSIQICLHEILECNYIDARRHLLLESKALELMRFGFDQLNSDKGQDISCFNLTTDSPNFVRKARNIMISDIQNPPSLTELSRMVGVNRNTLSQSFRRAYGVTIFNFLRNFRLEESRRLLRTGKLSVTQVAYEVGYAQQRTFSKEFKKYFGNAPSAYLG